MSNAGYRTGHIGKYHAAPEEVFHYETYLRGNTRNAVQMAEQSREFITEESEKPFFLYFATSDPHRGGGKDKTSTRDLKPDLFGNKPNRKSHEGVEEVFYDPKKVPIPSFLPDTLKPARNSPTTIRAFPDRSGGRPTGQDPPGSGSLRQNDDRVHLRPRDGFRGRKDHGLRGRPAHPSWCAILMRKSAEFGTRP